MSMMKKLSSLSRVLLLTSLVGCAGMSRSCAQCSARSFGSDWVVTQMDLDGRPYRCWELKGASISEETGDGITWEDTKSGNLVHISGHFNRVQVVGSNWAHAYETLGLTSAACASVQLQTYDPNTRAFVTVRHEK